ncbi:hypothetical protein [Anaerocolumna jejuensis]|nr:hypothetical protein [Anaerocolumna jejuensis]
MENFELRDGIVAVKERENIEKEQYLYHFTANDKNHIGRIMQTGYLKLTPSSLLKPTKWWNEMRNGVKTFCTDTDDYKSVVWMTNKKNAEGLGIDSGMSPAYVDAKKEICITIRMKDTFKWWNQWADENRMNKSWRKAFTSGMSYGSWYVSEEPIYMEDIVLIENMRTGEILFDNRQSKKAA